MNDLVNAGDQACLRRAVELAQEAKQNGNLPIGCVISLDGDIVAEGRNSIWTPDFDPTRHAEMEALKAIPPELRSRSRDMTLYSTLEPCLMCAAAILMYPVGRILFGSSDYTSGASCVFTHLPHYFSKQLSAIQWVGPAQPKLYKWVMTLVAPDEQTSRR